MNFVKYDYDINGRIKNVVSNGETAEYTYNFAGAVSEFKYGNGLKTVYEYDRLNRLTRLAGFDKKGRIIDERKIKYDAVGRKIMTDIITSDRIDERGKPYIENGRRYFTYDKKGQLTKVKYENGDSEEYGYDGFGNRTISKIRDFNGFRTESYSYDVLNRLIGIKENKDEKVLEYDSRGNLIKVRKGDEILESYIYDRTNRLIRAENSDKTVASFMYDGNGRRVRKENMHGVSEYVPDYTDEYNRVLFVSRKNGNESLIYGNGLIKSQNCGESFCHFENEMTSVMRITDNAGKTKRILQYSPFGDVYEFGKTKDIERTPLSFTGYECEENLNLLYAQARYYLPKIGRFAEEDINKGNGYLPESLNYYMYCYNNPLFYIDLNGKSPIVLRPYFERVGGNINAKADKDTSIAVVTYKGKTAVFYATNKEMNSSSSKNKAEETAEEYSTGTWFWKETPPVYSGRILSDGSMVVDSNDIIDAFGIPIVTHLPGDKFNSAQTAVDMYKEYNPWAGAINNIMGTAVYKIADKFTYSKPIDYKSLLNKSYVGNVKEQQIRAYVFSCENTNNNLEKIIRNCAYTHIPLHYKGEDGNYKVMTESQIRENRLNYQINDQNRIKKVSNFIKEYETFSSVVYDANPPKGDWTIGYGHKIFDKDELEFYRNNGITLEKANELFIKDMNKMLDTTFVPMLKKNNIYLNDDQFNAMIAFTYQFGENIWRDGETSTDSVRDFILSRNYSEKNLKAAFKPLMGAKALDGTVARLNDEIEMFLYGNYQRNYNYTRLN